MAKAKLIATNDGSHSIYLREMNETYHSTYGALAESLHVFLKEGVEYWQKNNSSQKARILEIGFGTGLNALMMLDYARKHEGRAFDFFTLEPYPIDQELYSQLNFAEQLSNITKDDLLLMHQILPEELVSLDNFHFTKSDQKVEVAELNSNFDLVFFDAFAPNKQPEMWSLRVLHKMYDCLNKNGLLVTYCAQGQFKRDLKEAGFKVETLEGPPGKKEMVRGVKC